MNKKFKIIIAAILILQIILPAGMLGYHYSAHKDAMTKSPEFNFKLEYLDIYEIYDDGNGSEKLSFEVQEVYDYYQSEMAVEVGDDGFAYLTDATNKILNKHWFTFKYYSNNSYHTSDDYDYVEGINPADIIYRVNALYSKDVPKPDGFYMTAKVYKGIFIPTAIYLDGTKVIVFKNELG